MIISARKVTARKRYRCDGDDCCYVGCKMFIEIGQSYYRLYGMADYPDPPYVMRLSARCCEWSPELANALARQHGACPTPICFSASEGV